MSRSKAYQLEMHEKASLIRRNVSAMRRLMAEIEEAVPENGTDFVQAGFSDAGNSLIIARQFESKMTGYIGPLGCDS